MNNEFGNATKFLVQDSVVDTIRAEVRSAVGSVISDIFSYDIWESIGHIVRNYSRVVAVDEATLVAATVEDEPNGK